MREYIQRSKTLAWPIFLINFLEYLFEFVLVWRNYFIHLNEEIENFFNSMTISKWRPYYIRGFFVTPYNRLSGQQMLSGTQIISTSHVVRDSSAVRRHYIFLLEPWDVRELCIRETADLLLQLWVSTFPRFVAIGFYFLSETLI